MLAARIVGNLTATTAFCAPEFCIEMKQKTLQLLLTCRFEPAANQYTVQCSSFHISGEPDFLPTTAGLLCQNPHFGCFGVIWGQFLPAPKFSSFD
jgi:hypothetical protein